MIKWIEICNENNRPLTSSALYEFNMEPTKNKKKSSKWKKEAVHQRAPSSLYDLLEVEPTKHKKKCSHGKFRNKKEPVRQRSSSALLYGFEVEPYEALKKDPNEKSETKKESRYIIIAGAC